MAIVVVSKEGASDREMTAMKIIFAISLFFFFNFKKLLVDNVSHILNGYRYTSIDVCEMSTRSHLKVDHQTVFPWAHLQQFFHCVWAFESASFLVVTGRMLFAWLEKKIDTHTPCRFQSNSMDKWNFKLLSNKNKIKSKEQIIVFCFIGKNCTSRRLICLASVYWETEQSNYFVLNF